MTLSVKAASLAVCGTADRSRPHAGLERRNEGRAPIHWLSLCPILLAHAAFDLISRRGCDQMSEKRSYFERAADALKEAFAATDADQEARALEKALRLNRLAVAEERAKRAGPYSMPSTRKR
jgi:hypothetical protein